MDTVTAINVLLVPDDETRERARALNAELRLELRWGFAFDETHQPHLTVVQRYVRSADLDRVLAAVGKAAAATDLDDLPLRGTGLSAAAFDTPPKTALVSIDVEAPDALRALQRRLVRALAPFSVSGGTAGAFFTTEGESGIGPATIEYVERFVPAHTGPRYAPHISVGVGDQRSVERLRRRFEGSSFRADALAAYQLGNLGTARRALRSWPRASLAA